MKMRNKIKKPMTDYAIELSINVLKNLKDSDNDPKQVLKQSILNSWQGLFEIKSTKKARGQGRLTYLERKERDRQEVRRKFLAKGEENERKD
jgi:hypothetical protein